MVSFCMLTGGCRVWFLMCKAYCTLDRQRFGLWIIGMLFLLSASCVSFLCGIMLLYLKLMSANCLSLRSPTATTDGWFPPVQAVSSAGLCNTFLEHLGARRRRLLWACIHLPSLRCGQPSAAATEAGWTLCWAGWLSWAVEDFFVEHVVLSFYSKDGVQADVQ